MALGLRTRTRFDPCRQTVVEPDAEIAVCDRERVMVGGQPELVDIRSAVLVRDARAEYLGEAQKVIAIQVCLRLLELRHGVGRDDTSTQQQNELLLLCTEVAQGQLACSGPAQEDLGRLGPLSHRSQLYRVCRAEEACGGETPSQRLRERSGRSSQTSQGLHGRFDRARRPPQALRRASSRPGAPLQGLLQGLLG
jgi:hypothetical protein